MKQALTTLINLSSKWSSLGQGRGFLKLLARAFEEKHNEEEN